MANNVMSAEKLAEMKARYEKELDRISRAYSHTPHIHAYVTMLRALVREKDELKLRGWYADDFAHAFCRWANAKLGDSDV